MVFNGEIYNFMELRAQLVEAGHTFSTDHSDTEVLLHGYEEWGEGMLAKLRGMFAFAIWNEAEQTLFCACYHFGIKPFYYYLTDEASCSSAARSRAFGPSRLQKGAEPESAGAVSQRSVFPGRTLLQRREKAAARPQSAVEGRTGGCETLLGAPL